MYICYTSTLVMGLIVAGLRPISTSLFRINYCYIIVKVIVAVILWPRSTSINISSNIMRRIVAGQTWPNSTTSLINWVRVAGILRPMSITLITSNIHWLRVTGLKRPMSTTSSPEDTSIPSSSEPSSLSLRRQEE